LRPPHPRPGPLRSEGPSPQGMTAVAVTTSPRSRLRHVDFVVLALYWVAIGYLWQSLGTLILPGMVQDLVGPADKGKALSLLEGIGTVMAVFWQPMMGAVSGYYGLANLAGILSGTVVAGLILHVAGRQTAFASIALLLVVTMLLTVGLVPDRVRPIRAGFSSPLEVVRATFTTPLHHPN